MIPAGHRPARVLVTGSTTWLDRAMVESALADLASRRASFGGAFVVITGMAAGADEFARDWANTNDVPLLAEPLDDGLYPEPMHRYNERMLEWEPELVLAFKDPLDPYWADWACHKGTEHMCRIASRAGLPVYLNSSSRLA